MLDQLSYEYLSDAVKLRVGEVTVRAGQLDNALTVAICQAGSTTLADAFQCAKNMRNRETILDESARYLKDWAASKGVDCDVDTIIGRAKATYRRRDEVISERCFRVEGEGDGASRCHWHEAPFDLEQLSAVAEEFLSIISEISAIDRPRVISGGVDPALQNSGPLASVGPQGQLGPPDGMRSRISPRRVLHTILAAFPFSMFPPV